MPSRCSTPSTSSPIVTRLPTPISTPGRPPGGCHRPVRRRRHPGRSSGSSFLARRAERVRRRVQHVPAVAARRWACSDRRRTNGSATGRRSATTRVAKMIRSRWRSMTVLLFLFSRGLPRHHRESRRQPAGARATTPRPPPRRSATADRIVSIVGAVKLGADLTADGWGQLLMFLALLTAGDRHPQPIPDEPFDGGHVAHRHVREDPRARSAVTAVGTSRLAERR